MTKLLLIGSVALCLGLLAGCTNAPKQPTPSSGEPPRRCPLVACPLPGRAAPVSNDDFRQALDATEAALQACAVQVLDCINRQQGIALEVPP